MRQRSLSLGVFQRSFRWCWIFRAVAIVMVLWTIGCPSEARAQSYTWVDIKSDRLVIQGQLNSSQNESVGGYFNIGTVVTLLTQGDPEVQDWLKVRALDYWIDPDTLRGYVRLTIAHVAASRSVTARVTENGFVVVDQVKIDDNDYPVIGSLTLMFRPDTLGGDPSDWLRAQEEKTVELALEVIPAT
ncbi:MAG: hypothetical protein Q8P83_01650 [bacterium]|nr:hypothetical protein [bacterium]